MLIHPTELGFSFLFQTLDGLGRPAFGIQRTILSMRYLLLTCTLLFCTHSLSGADKPNVLLICVDDLRPELNCFGVSYIHSPNIDALAKRGRAFLNHYVQAPTCGASRYTLLTGRYGPANNGALLRRGARVKKSPRSVPPSMPAWFRKHGYTTVSIGKVSHYPGGRAGRNWIDDTKLEMPNSWDRHLLPAGPWKHPRGWMHGLANGEIRVRAKDMAVFQAKEGPDSIYPDGVSIPVALRQLGKLAKSEKPFFLAVGILRPHLPFGAPAKYLKLYEKAKLPPTPHPKKPKGKTTWHGSGEFMKYKRWGRNPNRDAGFALAVRKHYAACVSYADAQVGKLLRKLKQSDAAKNTIVVLWGDHGWHLGEHAVWGKHTLFEESLRSPLIVSYPGLKSPGNKSRAIVETLDIFPTLCDLTHVPTPKFAHGSSLRLILDKPTLPGHPAFGYWRGAETIRTQTHRLIRHRKGAVELYDHTSSAKETKNIAGDHPKLVAELSKKLKARLKR